MEHFFLDVEPSFVISLVWRMSPVCCSEYIVEQDILFPYTSSDAINRLIGHERHRITRECQPVKFGEATFEMYPPHRSVPQTLPLVETR